ncbi:MAG: Hsp20/alpha crystallin family protein [Fuerstiella sp.]
MAFVMTHTADPFAAIRHDFERNLGLPRHSRYAAATILRDDDHFHVWLDVPGLSEDQIDIRFEDGMLTIESGEANGNEEGLKVVYDDRPARNFRRIFRLDDSVDPEQIDAELDNGVLRLRLKKREELKPRRIAVRSIQGISASDETAGEE